eukprot:26431_1
MYGLIYNVKGNSDGKLAWYLVLVDPDKLEQFKKDLNNNIIHLENLGHIIKSAYGTEPPFSAKEQCRLMFDYQNQNIIEDESSSLIDNQATTPNIKKQKALKNKLKQTILKNRNILVNGCGDKQCKNPSCKSNVINLNKSYSDKEASILAVQITKDKHKSCEVYKQIQVTEQCNMDIIAQLMQMGFNKTDCIKAVKLTVNYTNVQDVLNTLLSMSLITEANEKTDEMKIFDDNSNLMLTNINVLSDSTNMQQFAQMIDTNDEKQEHIEESVDVSPFNIRQRASKCAHNVANCPSIQNISNILTSYHRFMSQNQQANNQNVIDFILQQIHLPQHQKEVKLLIKIFENIISNPSNPKFQSLNKNIISNKFSTCGPCMDLLSASGFVHVVSDDGSRLRFDVKQLDKAKTIHNKLISLDRNDTNKLNMLNEMFLNYSHKQLMDDYGHLLYEHTNDIDSIHDYLILHTNNNSVCNIDQCNAFRRNHRCRSSNHCLTVYQCENINDILKLQTLESIHSHYFHIFNGGYRIRDDTIRKIERSILNDNNNWSSQNISRFWKSVSDEMSQHKHFMHSNNNKYMSHNPGLTVATYSFGYRYYYWNYYKHNQSTADFITKNGFHDQWNLYANDGYMLMDWYIPCKYNDFRDELINNSVCTISKFVFESELMKAQIKIQTQRAKNMKCCSEHENHYEVAQNQVVTLQHLLAMMIYCNMDLLQRKFTETYRKTTSNETDESLKQRHSNYAIFGKLLRELVECFGTEGNKT